MVKQWGLSVSVVKADRLVMEAREGGWDTKKMDNLGAKGNAMNI